MMTRAASPPILRSARNSDAAWPGRWYSALMQSETFPPPAERPQGASQRTLDQHDGATTQLLRRAMDALYWTCAAIAGSALVIISLVVPWGVYTRYVLDSAASWPEPMAILLSIVLTFFGAAASYRSGTHMRVTVLRDRLPHLPQRVIDLVAEGLMAVVSLFMIVWGGRLVLTTWHQVIAEFPFLSVGVTYLPIPLGGGVTLLFVIERLLIGPPPQTDWRQAAPD
jgi:TRAP-type C4-dicarboxylate transport system permease small subunit